MKKKFKIGLALGSGAARAIAHIGVLQVLEENNIEVDCISGSSMGAIVGGIYSLGISPYEMERNMLKIIVDAKKKLFKIKYDLEALFSTKYIHKTLCKYFSKKTFKDLKIPFYPVAVDLISGKKVIFQSGKLIDAIEASSSIPVYYTPKKRGKKVLVDGSVLCPVPTKVLRDKCDFVISVAIPAYNKNKHPHHYLKMLNVMDRSIAILVSKLMQVELENSKPDFLIHVDKVSSYEGSDYNKAKQIIKIGRGAAKKVIKELKKDIDNARNN